MNMYTRRNVMADCGDPPTGTVVRRLLRSFEVDCTCEGRIRHKYRANGVR